MKMRLLRNCLTTVACLSLAASTNADWPQFRGPDGQGHSEAGAFPIKWSPTDNVAWVAEIPGAGWSSPVIQGTKIFLTTGIQSGRSGNMSLRAICLDQRDGKIVWSREIFSILPVAAHKKNGHASPTPVVEGERLFVHFGQYGTAALDLDGNVVWTNTSLKYSPVHGNGGSPAIVGEALIFSCDGSRDPFIAALKKSDGGLLWKTARNNNASKTFSFSTPLAIEAGGTTQVVSPTSAGVMAYDPKDGREIWRVRYPEGYSVVPRPVTGHGLVYVSSAFDRPVIYAIEPNGTGDNTERAVKWTINRGAPNTPSPLLVGDEIYFISDAGIMTCADARSGKVYWQERITGNYSASPVFAGGRIYVQSEEGVGTVLAPDKQFQVAARNDLKERTLASYALADGAIYIRTEQRLYCIRERAGKDK